MRWFSLFLLPTLLACDRAEPRPFAVPEPDQFAAILYPPDNPSTAAGIELGRRLFFDPILSVDSTISCASCHDPDRAFTDGRIRAVGLGGRVGRRNTPGLANVGYLHATLFWDGRADNLESQALHPVGDPNEMGGSWPQVITALERNARYRTAIPAAVGENTITKEQVGKLLAQYQRSLISADSKYDRVAAGRENYTDAEALGAAIFFDLGDEEGTEWFGRAPAGECAHCHTPPHFTNQRFFNNGLDETTDLDSFPDPGRGAVTGNRYDNGLFKVPGLRNVALTAPYMHDGRMATLREVVDHYASGGRYAENRSANVFPLPLTETQKGALVAFLQTLTDTSFVYRAAHRPPITE